MIPRNAENILKEVAKGYPAIGITGPRQSGKTTLARHVFQDKPFVSLEPLDTRTFAQNDPRGFLEQYLDGAILDEVQRCPDLFSYLQVEIDANPEPGRFILTGSQQFGLMSHISQSLAGRIALLHLLPFTYHELYQETNPPLDTCLFTGLYPPIHDRNLNPHLWYANYMQTYIERDVRQMINIQDLTNFQRFIRLCAGRTGQLLNYSNLASDCGITHNTARAWVSILEASYIIFLLQPHHENFNKRLIKTPKLYFYDTGLASWLLGIQNPDQLNTHALRGSLFESFVVSEMVKKRFNQGLTSNLYFWRDHIGQEIDILRQQGEHLQPIEIKSGQTLNQDYFTGLQKWLDLAKDKAIDPMLIYGGQESQIRSDICVYPWQELGWQ